LHEGALHVANEHPMFSKYPLSLILHFESLLGSGIYVSMLLLLSGMKTAQQSSTASATTPSASTPPASSPAATNDGGGKGKKGRFTVKFLDHSTDSRPSVPQAPGETRHQMRPGSATHARRLNKTHRMRNQLRTALHK